MIRVRRTDDLDAVMRLHNRCMPADRLWLPDGRSWMWLATDCGRAIGYATAYQTELENVVFMSAAGVLASHRGRGIHGRLIAARVAMAKRLGVDVITYTLIESTASANNLMDAGFRSYRPAFPYVGERVNYWYLETQK